ncbi:Ovarian cancer-associated protein 2 [Dimargaris cristalligena]|nr:Ovarian cancer-associated protein 2 [Dimargaris cristalligena]
MTNGKLRILCLHGHVQSGPVFRAKTGSLRKGLKQVAEFEYISSPLPVELSHASPSDEPRDNASDGAVKEEPKLGWFRVTNDASGHRLHDLQKCLDTIKHALETMGPFDGILGFSQGAAIVAIVLLIIADQKKTALKGVAPSSDFHFQVSDPSLLPRFVILYGGFQVNVKELAQLYQPEAVEIPSLHVIGQSDVIIAPGAISVSHAFKNPELLYHPGGHFVPASPAQVCLGDIYNPKIV